MKIYNNIVQGSDEWEEIRKGKITGSTFGNLITPANLTKSTSMTAKEALCKIIGNAICVDNSDDEIKTGAMERGIAQESNARDLYVRTYIKPLNAEEILVGQNETEVKEVGFVESDCGYYGFSPDGLVGENGMIEIKTQCQKKHIYCKVFGFDEWLKKYKAQILLSMITNSDIKWCDCISYNEDFEDDNRLIVYRYNRNEEEIEKAKVVLDYWVEELKKYK